MLDSTKAHAPQQSFALRPASDDEIPAIVEVLNTYANTFMDPPARYTPEALHREWHGPGFDMARDLRVATTDDGRIVGFVCLYAMHHPPVHPSVWGGVHPDFQRRGIGSALLTWAEERAQALLPDIPPDLRVSIHNGAFERNPEAVVLLERHGFTRIRSSYRMAIRMEAPPPPAIAPAGVTIRGYDHERDALTVYRAAEASFEDHWGHIVEPEAEGFARWLHSRVDIPDFDPTLWFVAEAGNEVAGFVVCRPRAPDTPAYGYIQKLGVLRPWRRQGLGHALLLTAFNAFWTRGQPAVALGVDASNLTGATRLYERAGMAVTRVFHLYEKELRPGREYGTEQVSA